ncbi:uncharacterized protein LOC114295323 [Camellia sinensis]|uniref:uncharacterized protein LOC114295323 n=1 Tax=Camellia sinensis TaxID=4442 RepID=UPI0010368588|nr:uncharacterized protein LOC114295323 [Camellia sinensis]
MASGEREFEEQLEEAGNRLLQPPSSVDELLPLLDQVENFLSRVEQSPSKSMQTALSPSMKALVADELLRHPDVDVKVAVASCISEITRITAPDAPYDDDQMKDVFRLIVSSFENLSDKSSRSYSKRTLILETVAKVRSCVVMLDLECDGLIVEMFHHFLKAIRDYHPENVFSSMVTIMSLVLEESEDISFELISPILASVKKDNQEVLPIARKLGEKVFKNCAIKVKPYLMQAMKSLGLSSDDYIKVISSICDGTNGAVGDNDDNACGEQLTEVSKLARASSEGAAQADENKLTVASSDGATQDQMTKESVTETRPEEDHPAVDGSPKSVMSNGVAETGNEDRLADPESSKKQEHAHQVDQSVDTIVTSNAEPDDSDSGKIEKSESKPEQTSKKRGQKLNSLINSTEPSDSSRVESDKVSERMADRQTSHSKEVPGSPSEEPSVEVAVTSENDKENVKLSSPKAIESESMNVASPSPSGSVPDEGRLKKAGRPKKRDNLVQDIALSANVVSKKASDGTSDLEVKPQRRSGKKALAGSTEEKTPAPTDKSKSEGGTSDSEEKPLKDCVRKVDAKDDIVDGPSSKKKEDGKRRGGGRGRGRGRGKATLVKDLTKSPTDDDDKEAVSSPKLASKLDKDEGRIEETTKTSSKRKRTPGKEKRNLPLHFSYASDTIEYDGNLIGKKVKVWWPEDEMFYEGVIDDFDPVKKKHKVSYTDGDEEILNLRNERWELVSGNSESDGEQATECQSPDPSSDMHKKKKAKTNPEPSAKQGKREGSRGGEASSRKSKGDATKSGRKSKDDTQVDGKSKDNTSKSSAKSKDNSQKSSGKSVVDASKSAGKSTDVDGGTPKTGIKFKLDSPKAATKDTPKATTKDTPKTASKSKGKASKSGNKSNANGSGKVKAGSAKAKETEEKEKSPETVKTPKSAKGKSPDASKGQETGAKSGKKRRRGAKS